LIAQGLEIGHPAGGIAHRPTHGGVGRRGLPDDGDGDEADKKNGGRPQTREETDPSGRTVAATLIRHDSIPAPNQRGTPAALPSGNDPEVISRSTR
jgi:hypothetical protein